MRVFSPRCTTLKMKHYERRLPHWDLSGHPLFVTFRLHGSLPSGRVFPPVRLSSGKAFVAIDRILDKSASGPLYLRMPEIAALVVKCLHDGERRFHRYQMHSFVVMANHVHLLVTPQVAATRWLRSSARNLVLGRYRTVALGARPTRKPSRSKRNAKSVSS